MSNSSRIKEGHLGYIELIGTLTILLATKAFLTVPRTAMLVNLQGGWIYIVTALAFTLVSFFFINKLFNLFPGLSLDEINLRVMGSWLGIPANLTIIAFFVLYLIITLREFSELIIQSILPNTPLSNLLIIFMILVMYGCYLGIETITRAAWLKAPFILLAFILLLLLSTPNANIDNMYPIFGRGILPGVQAGFVSVSRFGEGILCLGLLIPFIRYQKEVGKIGYISICISGLIIFSAIVIFQLVFGVTSGLVSGTFPIFQVVRLISYGTFFQRIEAIFIFIWIISALISVTIIFYCLTLTVARQLKLPTYRPLIFPMALIIYTVSFLPPDFLSTVALEMNTIRKYGGIPAVLIPILVLIMAKIKGLKGGQEDEQKIK